MSHGLLGADFPAGWDRFLARQDVELRRGHGSDWSVKLGPLGADRIVCGDVGVVPAAITTYLERTS